MSIIIIKTVKEMHALSDSLRMQGKTIGFVPTMGFLHEGHAALIQKAASENDIVIVSVFVNPLQFSASEDYGIYPKNFEGDCAIIEQSHGNILFYPTKDEMYPANFSTSISIGNITNTFEGFFRPGHFEGVATVVAKLLLTTKPHHAYFGQKDYQQTLVIQRLIQDLHIDCSMHIVPTVREDDGLAKSSRNVYLQKEEREQSTIIFKALMNAKNAFLQGERNRLMLNTYMHETLSALPQFDIQYASCAEAETLHEPDIFEEKSKVVFLIAGYLGKTRLIDNMVS
jgi:pantoate--beta-alanine ligase